MMSYEVGRDMGSRYFCSCLRAHGTKVGCGIEHPALKMVSYSYTNYSSYYDNEGQKMR
jgi:hypothetical protein